MNKRAIAIGDVIVIIFPQQMPPGREQFGMRPAIVAGLPDTIGKPRYPILFVVPLTTQIGRWAKENPQLYPVIKAGSAGVPKKSVALLDQLRAVDAKRIYGYIGALDKKIVKHIQEQLIKIIALV